METQLVILSAIVISSIFALSRAFECDSYGYFADPDNCKNYYYCDWDFQATLHPCPTGTYFDPKSQDCSETKCLNSASPVDMTCNSNNDMFPDPDDPHKYFQCDASLVPVHEECFQGKGCYDPNSQLCTDNADADGNCPDIPPVGLKCTSSEDLFPDPDDPHKYFQCDAYLNLVHEECFQGKGCYDPNSQLCSDNADADGNCPDIPPAGLICTSSKEMFPDPDDPHNYYQCDASLMLELRKCFQGQGCYDPNSQTCVEAADSERNCPDFPPPGMKCDTSHDLFPDPADCHKYYRCDASLQLIHDDCFDGYYDNSTEQCIKGDCP